MNQQIRNLVAPSKPVVRAEPIIPKVTVEIAGAADATRHAIESAIVSALRNVASERVDVKWVLACQ